MSDGLRWGVLGHSLIGRVCVVPAIQKSSNGIVHTLASRRPERAEAFAREQKIDQLVDDYNTVLADPEIDAVYIPLPNNLHRLWAIKALEAGKHVLCEKPLALNATEATEMVDAAQANQRYLMEAFMYRFHPRSQHIKEMVAKGEIGKLRFVHAAFSFMLTDEENYRLKPEMGGGALLDVGCYGVSVATWLAASSIQEVQATAHIGPTGVDLSTTAILRFENGCTATIQSSFEAALQQTYNVTGTQGSIELPHNAFIPREDDAIYYTRGLEDEIRTEHTIPGQDEYLLMVEHFADVALGHAPEMFPTQGSIETMHILDQIAEAAGLSDSA